MAGDSDEQRQPVPILQTTPSQKIPTVQPIGPEGSNSVGAPSKAIFDNVPAQLLNIATTADGQGGRLTFSSAIAPRREGDPKSPQNYDPWTATEEQAMSFPGAFVSVEFGDWIVAHWVSENRAKIEANGMSLLRAVDMVLGRGLVAPHWLSAAFTARWRKINAYEVRTLDEAFGHQPLNPRTIRAAQRSAGMMKAVHAALVSAVEADPEQPIHAGFPYEDVGDSFGIGKTLCYDLYRMAVDEHGMQDLADLRKVLKRVNRKGQGPAKSARSPGLRPRR